MINEFRRFFASHMLRLTLKMVPKEPKDMPVRTALSDVAKAMLERWK